ncbi:MAG: hypothetical protein JNN33_09360 [Rhodospirillaceae bacterium]|jgi:hypothetical protein|nr:hypothetical protein [Rhodospirillaceae bacterium]
MSIRSSWKAALRAAHRGLLWCDRSLPRYTRGALGVLLVLASPLGLLPVLGFWMLPLGLGLIALEVPPWRRRMLRWLERQQTCRRDRLQP